MSEIAINTVFCKTTEPPEHLIRIIWIDANREYLQYVSLSQKVSMPHPIKVVKFEELINNDFLAQVPDAFARVIDEEQILAHYKSIRDAKWKIIQFIWDRNKEKSLLKQERPDLFAEAAKLFNVHPMEVTRMMSRFWQRGMIPNALLPDYYKRGSRGLDTKIKRGRPRLYVPVDVDSSAGINVTEDLKQKIQEVIDLFYLTKQKPTIKDAYQQLLVRYFSDVKYEDGKRKHIVWSTEKVPTYHQFYYWFNKFTDAKTTILRRDGDREFALKYRELLGDTSAETFGPGFKYQIDATIADVYLVSVKNPDYIVGRPVVYIVMDVFSRLVVGMYVGIEGPSWLGAMMALDNVVADKVEFCKDYDVKITPEEWPSTLLPERLLADRGEFEGYCPEGIIANLGISLENTPPYRGDLKGIVERHFRTTNDRIKTRLPGAVRKVMKERGTPDHRLDATLNIDDFTKIMILEVKRHNKSVLEHYNKSMFEIHDSVEPVPIKIWDWGTKNRRCGFVARDRDFVRLSLMPKESATITRQGIRFHGLFYTCDLAIKEGWFINPKKSSVKVAYDLRRISNIYIPANAGNGFTKCFPVPNSEDFGDMSFDDYDMLQKYLAEEKMFLKPDKTQIEIDTDQAIQEVVRKAKNKAKQTKKDINISNNERVKGIRANREQERNERRKSEGFELKSEKERNQSQFQESQKGEIVNFPDGDTPRKTQKDYEDEILDLLNRERNERRGRKK